MTHPKITKMLEVPGIYIFVGGWQIFLVEVDALQVCEQLKPEYPFQRDGVLSLEGWSDTAVEKSTILGPFARQRDNDTQVVPKVPTQAMLDAVLNDPGNDLSSVEALRNWEVMLSYAPEAL